MRYTLFNQDGSHAANIECHPDDAPYQAFDGQVIIEGDYGNGYYYDGEKVCVKPTQPTPAHEWIDFKWVLNSDKLTEQFKSAQIEAFKNIRRKHAQMLDQLTGGVTEQERSTWQLKLPAAAASIAAGDPTDAAITLFYGEAEEDGVTVMIKCQRCAKKSEAYHLLIGMAECIKTRAENAVKAAVDVAQIEAALTQAMSDAQAAAGQYLQMIGQA